MSEHPNTQIARIETKLDALNERLDRHDQWERSIHESAEKRHDDQETRVRSMEKHRNFMYGLGAAALAAAKFGLLGGPK
tara:strand:- start:578 stop:814 length:237 start_codon:yes stop_codon:yes gene_type:complete